MRPKGMTFIDLLIVVAAFLIGVAVLSAHASKETIEMANVVAKHAVDLDDDESTVTRHVDCEAGTVIWVVNSKTYGHAVGVAVLPMDRTLLSYKEVCGGPNKDN